jgi:hypothetical protein
MLRLAQNICYSQQLFRTFLFRSTLDVPSRNQISTSAAWPMFEFTVQLEDTKMQQQSCLSLPQLEEKRSPVELACPPCNRLRYGTSIRRGGIERHSS